MFVFWYPCARANLHQQKRALKLCSATLSSLFTQQCDQLIVTVQIENAPGGKVFNRKRNYRKTLPILEDLGVTYPTGCQRFFFSLGATELSGEGAKTSREADQHYSLWRSSPLASEKTSGIQGKHHMHRWRDCAIQFAKMPPIIKFRISQCYDVFRELRQRQNRMERPMSASSWN